MYGLYVFVKISALLKIYKYNFQCTTGFHKMQRDVQHQPATLVTWLALEEAQHSHNFLSTVPQYYDISSSFQPTDAGHLNMLMPSSTGEPAK